LGPGTASGANCNIKATPAADSTSCKDDAVVTMAESDNILTVRREGRAELTLASNPTIRLATSRSYSWTASYVEGDLIARARATGRIPKDAFFPYILGRMDDWSLLDTEDHCCK
jgi:hypothetical protein